MVVEDGALRISDLNVVLDTEDSTVLAEKQGVQWMIADSAMELYQCKLMVLHAAYKIDKGEDFRLAVAP